MTVIYSCFGAAPNDTGFAAAYNLVEEAFVPLAEITPAIHLFPLRKLYVTTELLDFRTALQAHPNKEILQKRLDSLISAVTEYKIPTVTLKDLEVEEVCPIFERINSSGTKLSTYDLMVAATWSQEFDLDDRVEEIAISLEPKGFGDIEKSAILKCMSAVALGSIKDSSLKSLREKDSATLQSITATSREAMLRTVDLLSTEFGIHSWDFLTYEAIVVVICSILAKKGAQLDAQQVVRLKQWFWRAALAERYKVGGEAFVSNDLEKVHGFVIDGNGKPADFGIAPAAADWTNVTFRSNASRSRAFLIALGLNKPRNLLNGAAIDTKEALSSFNKKQYHHVYPRAYLRRIGDTLDDNLLLNICMLPAVANQTISDKDPNKYLPETISSLGTNADAVFRSNMLPLPSTFSYANEPYASFINARSAVINDVFRALCGADR